MIMSKKDKRNYILVFAGIIAIVFILGFAGSADYDDYVILHMPYETYDKIYGELSADGSSPSDHDIVLEYNRRYRHAENR